MTQELEDRRVKVVTLKVRYGSATVDEFIDKHALDVSRSGIYIMTANPFPPGTLLKFEVLLANGRPVITGVGRVAWKRDGSQVSAVRPAGMGVKFIEIDELSTALVDRLVAARPDAGLVYEEEDETSSSAAADAPSESHSPVFPKSEADGKAPPTDEPTLMKHVSELLEEALHETGGSMEELANPLFSGIAPAHDALAPAPSVTRSSVKEFRASPPLPPLPPMPRVKAWPVMASLPAPQPVAPARAELSGRRRSKRRVLLAFVAVAAIALTPLVPRLFGRSTPTSPSVQSVMPSAATARSVAPEMASASALPAGPTPTESTPGVASTVAPASVAESASAGSTMGATTGSMGTRKARPTAKGAPVSSSTPKPPWKTALKYVDDNPY